MVIATVNECFERGIETQKLIEVIFQPRIIHANGPLHLQAQKRADYILGLILAFTRCCVSFGFQKNEVEHKFLWWREESLNVLACQTRFQFGENSLLPTRRVFEAALCTTRRMRTGLGEDVCPNGRNYFVYSLEYRVTRNNRDSLYCCAQFDISLPRAYHRPGLCLIVGSLFPAPVCRRLCGACRISKMVHFARLFSPASAHQTRHGLCDKLRLQGAKSCRTARIMIALPACSNRVLGKHWQLRRSSRSFKGTAPNYKAAALSRAITTTSLIKGNATAVVTNAIFSKGLGTAYIKCVNLSRKG